MEYIEYTIYALIFFYLVGLFSSKGGKTHKQAKQKNSKPINKKERKPTQTQANVDSFEKISHEIESLNGLNEASIKKIEQAKKQNNYKLANKLYPKYLEQKIRVINLNILQNKEILGATLDEFSEINNGGYLSHHLVHSYFEYSTSLAMDGSFDEAHNLISGLSTLGVPELTNNIFYPHGTDNWILQQLRFQLHLQELAKIECNGELYIQQGILIICIKMASAQYDKDISKTKLCNLAFGVGGKYFLSINSDKKKYKEAKDWLWDWQSTTKAQTYNNALQLAREKSKELNNYLFKSS